MGIEILLAAYHADELRDAAGRWTTTVTNGERSYEHTVIGSSDVAARRTLSGILKRKNALLPYSQANWRMTGPTRRAGR